MPRKTSGGKKGQAAPRPGAVREAPVRSPLRVLFDTNVILDAVLDRRPWATEARKLLDGAAGGAVEGFVAGHAITAIHHVVEREVSMVAAATAVADILTVLEVVALGHAGFERALSMRLADFEDSLQVSAALVAGADYIVTRNAADFRGTPVPTRPPGALLATLAASGYLPGER